MILAVTPNPSLDKTTVIRGFRTGRIFRPGEVLRLAGGKGLNVARALLTLGERVMIVGPLAGHTGRAVLDLAQDEGLTGDFVWVSGETRTCLSVIDPHSGEITEVYEAGPTLTAVEWEHVSARAGTHLRSARLLAVCGSIPPGVPVDGLTTLVEQASAAGVSTVLDTLGPHTGRVLRAHPALVKLNQAEAGELLGREIAGPDGALEAAAYLRSLGAGSAVITLGPRGAVGLDDGGETFAWGAPRTSGAFTVGCGDAFLAGVAASLSRGGSLREAVRLGVVAGAANTLQIGAGVFTAAQVEALLPQVRVLPLGADS